MQKPFIRRADDGERKDRKLWKSVELFMYYHDWMFLHCIMTVNRAHMHKLKRVVAGRYHHLLTVGALVIKRS